MRLSGLLILLGLFLLACATVPLRPGERLARAKCTACHLSPERDRFDRPGWIEILDDHQKHFPLTEAERCDLLDWLVPAEGM
jgi:hypothetical protein